MSGNIHLSEAWIILEKELDDLIESYLIDEEDPKIKIELKDGIFLYIQYNHHNQYSYSIIFSSGELDRCRFDNYDDKWKNSTRPNHFHPRFNKSAFNSPMTGNPTVDMHNIIELIKKGSLFDKLFRF